MSQGGELKINYARPRARARARRGRSPRVLARNAVVAGASVGVLVLLAFVAFAAPSAKLRADVGPVVPRPGSNAVVEGRVLSASGGGLEGAQVAVLRSGGKREIASSGENGAFRLVLEGGCSVYTVLVRAKATAVIDALLWAVERARLLQQPVPPTRSRRILLTLPSRESHGDAMRGVCHAVRRLAERGDVELVFPVHRSPAVRRNVVGLDLGRRIGRAALRAYDVRLP